MHEDSIKILIVDDSKTARELLKYVMEKDPQLKVVGFAENGNEALAWLKTNTCDVISMDIHMPFINGFLVTEKIMATKPIPTVIISSGYTKADKQMAFKALEAGALSILEKPVGIGESNFNEKAKNIIDTIKTISGVKMVTRRPKTSEKLIKTLPKPHVEHEIRAVAIGASLGGPQAISEILKELNSSFPVPIYIVQHIACGFVEGFSEWLQESTSIKISLAKDKEKAMPNNIYIAPDACQMEIKSSDIITLINNGNIQPSVSKLFKSMANTYGPHCVGVMLTGMGSDGANEMFEMYKKGAYTIAQDKESSIMFGMPNEAIVRGGVRQILPLNRIAETLNHLVSKI